MRCFARAICSMHIDQIDQVDTTPGISSCKTLAIQYCRFHRRNMIYRTDRYILQMVQMTNMFARMDLDHQFEICSVPNVCCVCTRCRLFRPGVFEAEKLLRGTVFYRTYGTYKKLYNSLFSPTLFGPIYYGPP